MIKEADLKKSVVKNAFGVAWRFDEASLKDAFRSV